jgi:hypothetical protein
MSPFDLWFEASKEELQDTHPDQSEEDLGQVAVETFRSLSKEERQVKKKSVHCIL